MFPLIKRTDYHNDLTKLKKFCKDLPQFKLGHEYEARSCRFAETDQASKRGLLRLKKPDND